MHSFELQKASSERGLDKKIRHHLWSEISGIRSVISKFATSSALGGQGNQFKLVSVEIIGF